MRDLLTSEQLVARGFFREIDHPEAGTCAYPGPPSRMPATPPQPRRAPLLSEHTFEVLRDVLGLTARDVALLSAAGVV
jgi:formyl-CoA transferase